MVVNGEKKQMQATHTLEMKGGETKKIDTAGRHQ